MRAQAPNPLSMLPLPTAWFNDVDFTGGESANYPPVNVKYRNDGKEIVIEMAVAGFSADDVRVEEEDNRIIVTGELPQEVEAEAEGWQYETRRIAYRKFRRVWAKKSNYTIDNCSYKNGILKIVIAKSDANVKAITVQVDS